MSLISVLSLFIFFLPLFFELYRQYVSIRFDGLTVINISYSIIYGLTAFLLSADLIIVDKQFNQLDLFVFPTFQSLALILLSYFFCAASYVLIRFDHFKFYFNSYSIEFKTLLYKASLIAVSLSIIFVFIYSYQYGGVVNAVRIAATIRSGHGDDHLVGSGNFLFFKYLLPLCIYPGLLSFYYVLTSDNKSFRHYFILIILTLFCSLCFMLMSGRGRIVLYLFQLALLFFYIKADGRRLKFSVAAFFVMSMFLALLVVNYGKSFFSMLSNEQGFVVTDVRSESESNLLSFSKYYIHRVASIDVTLQSNNEFTYFYDLIYSPLYFIPERITGLAKPESISFINTYNYIGVRESIVPPGLVAYGYLSLGVVGVVLISIFVGSVLKFLHVLFYEKAGPRLVLYVPAISYFGNYLFASDPRVTINATVHFFAFLVLIYVCSKRLKLN